MAQRRNSKLKSKRKWNVGAVAHLGGIATRERLTAEERRHSAQRAAFARWANVPAEERSAITRKAVQVRWARARAKGQSARNRAHRA